MRVQEKEKEKDEKHIERLIKKNKGKGHLLTPDLSHLDNKSTESILQPNSSGI